MKRLEGVMFRNFFSLCFLVGLFVSFSCASADSWLPPKARIFVSQNGVYGFKIFPPAKADERRPTNEWMGELFSVQSNGSLKSVWTKRIVNIPMEVFISNDGHVVTLDTYANLGFAHSIVIYDKQGQVLGDYSLEQVLTRSDIANHVDKTVSSRWWRNGAEYEFMMNGDFVIKLQWGKRVEVNLGSGKISYK